MEELTCIICLELLYQPVSLSTCPHTFCLPCLRTHANTSAPKCPSCNSPLSSNIRSVLSTSDCISGSCNEQLRNLKVSCPHCHGWSGILGVNRTNLIAHRTECGQYPVLCRVGCRQLIARSQLEVHERDDWPRRLVECERSHERVRSESLEKHQFNERECEKCHDCALGCGELVLDKVKEAHISYHCLRRMVKCLGCDVELEHRHLESHLHATSPIISPSLPLKPCPVAANSQQQWMRWLRCATQWQHW